MISNFKIKNTLFRSVIISSLIFIFSFSFANMAPTDPIKPGGGSVDVTSGTGGGSIDVTSGTTKPATDLPRLKNPISANSIQDLLLKIADFAVMIGTLFAVLVFIWIGFKFIEAQGNSKGIDEAKQMLFYAVIGVAILISSKVIVEVVKNTLISSGVVDQRLFNNTK